MGRLEITAQRILSQYPGNVDAQLNVLAKTLNDILLEPEVNKTIKTSQLDLSKLFDDKETVVRYQYFEHSGVKYCWWLFHSEIMGQYSYYGLERVNEPDSELLWSDMLNGDSDHKDFLNRIRMLAGFDKTARQQYK